MMKAAFGWELDRADGKTWEGKIQWGKNGIDGFLLFLHFCVLNCGLEASLIEMKVEFLLGAINNQYVAFSCIHWMTLLTKFPGFPLLMDYLCWWSYQTSLTLMTFKIRRHLKRSLKNLPKITSQNQKMPKLSKPSSLIMPCIGICLVFPLGKDPHSSYPFGIHSQHSLPWNYQSIEDQAMPPYRCNNYSN